MVETQAPLRLWCFAYEYASEIQCLLANGTYDLQGRTPYEFIMQYTPDISEYVIFHWYQWSYYWDEQSKQKKLCRWLGIAHQVGQAMCFNVLLSTGEFIARSTVIPIPEHELNTTALKEQMALFTSTLHAKIGDHTKSIVKGEAIDNDCVYYDAFFDKEEEDNITWPWEQELQDLPLADQTQDTMDALDEYIGANIVLPGINGEPVLTTIKGRKRDYNG